MKKHKLLVSALCLSLTVAQLPLGVIAAPANNPAEMDVIAETAQTVSDDVISEDIAIDETETDIVREAEYSEFYEESSDDFEVDHVSSDLVDNPDFTPYDLEHVVLLEFDGVEAYGENSNVYTLDYTGYNTLNKKFDSYSYFYKSGDMVTVLDMSTGKGSITFIPRSYKPDFTYTVTAFANMDIDISDQISANPDGSYTLSLETMAITPAVKVSAKPSGTSKDVASLFAGGAGTESDPYQISTYEQLKAMAEVPYEGVYFKLTEDIDCSAATWTPVYANHWHFDGNGKTISNLKICPDPDRYASMFAQGGIVSEVKDLCIENVTYLPLSENEYLSVYAAAIASKANVVTGCSLKGTVGYSSRGYLAGLVYEVSADGTEKVVFSNNTNESDMTGSAWCAGLVWWIHAGDTALLECVDNVNKGDIYTSGIAAGLFGQVCGLNKKNSVQRGINYGDVTGRDSSGIAYSLGEYYAVYMGTMEDCVNNGTITSIGYADSYESACGIVRCIQGDAQVIKCVNLGKIIANNADGAGIAGSSVNGGHCKVSRCYNLADVTGIFVSGILLEGYDGDIVEYCYNSGCIKSVRSYDTFLEIGGIVQYANGLKISNCFNTGCVDAGDVSCQNMRIGGIAGDFIGGTIENCYNVGKIKGSEKAHPYAIAGMAFDSTITVKNNYYLKDGDLKAVGIQDGTMNSKYTATGLTGASMAKQASFKNWNFTDVWQIGVNENYPYPELRSNPYQGLKVEIDSTPGTDDPDPGKEDPNPGKVDPDPAEPVEVVEGGIYASGQKFDIRTAECLGTSYGKYVVTPKNAASIAVKTGLVTVKNAPADGKVTITGQTKNSKGKWVDTKSFSFTVFKPAFTVKTITFTSPYDETINPDDATASVDGNTLLKDTTVMPATWTSANPKIAAVDPETGLITAVSKGSTKITAVYGDPESNNCAKYPITVKVNIPKISKTGASLLTGANLTLKLSGAPKNAAIVWTSSDPENVSVDPSTGKVNALKFNEEAEGKAVISASCNGYTFPAYECEVSVTKPELAKSGIVIKTGKSSKITLKKTKFKVKPENVTFESTDDTKAEVDQTGKVTGKATGEVTINVTIAGVTLPCKVTVQ